MCSLTFWPGHAAYRLAMNRDERLSRGTGLPPVRFADGSRTVLHPREPGGGTWISVNDAGVGIALINWYAVAARAAEPASSRGAVVLALRDCADSLGAADRLERLPLSRTNPFRVIGIFPRESAVREWRWNLRRLTCRAPDWSPQQWLSSGHDEPAARRIRGDTFTAWRTAPDAGGMSWLRRLHASHHPECGPFSICMHRADAATVSYTEIEVAGASVAMRHCQGPPCGGGELVGEVI